MIFKKISFGLISSFSILIIGLVTFNIINKLLSVEVFGNFLYFLTIIVYLT